MNEAERLELEARLMAEFEEQIDKMGDEELEALIQAAPQLSDALSLALAALRKVAVALANLRLNKEGDE